MKRLIILTIISYFFCAGSCSVYAAQKTSPLPNKVSDQAEMFSMAKERVGIGSQTTIFGQKRNKRRTRKYEKENDPVRLVKQSRKIFKFGLISYLISGIYIPLSILNRIPIFPIIGFVFCLIAFIKAVRAVRLLKENPEKYDESLLKRAKISKTLSFLGTFVPLLAVAAGLIMLYLYF